MQGDWKLQSGGITVNAGRHDNKITIGDLAIVAAAYGKTSRDPNWAQYQKADLSLDGKVDIEDLAMVAGRIID